MARLHGSGGGAKLNIMKLIPIRKTFWINIEHVTDAWVQSNEPNVLRFRLSSDGNDGEIVIRESDEIKAFCEATGFCMPSSE